MRKRKRKPPLCIVIAGPNGAGKTTFAKEFLLKDAGIVHFVNPDLIAGGLSDTWSVYDNSGAKPRLQEEGP